MANAVKPIPDGYGAVTPYLIVRDAAAAIEFYKKAFSATEVTRMAMPDGKIAHAEIRIGGSMIMLADENPQWNAQGPMALGGSPVSIMLYVDDVDTVVRRAVESGAKVTREVADQFYGDRAGGITDPYGHQWHIATHVEDVPPEEIERRAKEMFGQAAG